MNAACERFVTNVRYRCLTRQPERRFGVFNRRAASTSPVRPCRAFRVPIGRARRKRIENRPHTRACVRWKRAFENIRTCPPHTRRRLWPLVFGRPFTKTPSRRAFRTRRIISGPKDRARSPFAHGWQTRPTLIVVAPARCSTALPSAPVVGYTSDDNYYAVTGLQGGREGRGGDVNLAAKTKRNRSRVCGNSRGGEVRLRSRF